MIDKPTIARIMDSTKIEEVVSEFVTLKSAASTMSACVLSITIPIRRSPFRQPEASVTALPVERVAMPSISSMELEQMTYPDALRWLAKKYNIEIRNAR